ncbi:MAG TPA: hypothetical protein VF339_04255 [Gammaproteobacteria bacterium]
MSFKLGGPECAIVRSRQGTYSKTKNIQTAVPTAAEHAARLLIDAAKFLRAVADRDPDLRDQMRYNADVFERMSALLAKDPLQQVGEGSEERPAATVFRRRPAWIEHVNSALGPGVGDRMPEGPHVRESSWTHCSFDEAEEWRRRLARLSEGETPRLAAEDLTRLADCTLWTRKLPFFEEGTLLHAVLDTTPMDAFFLSYRAGRAGDELRLRPVSGAIQEVHLANADAPLLLDGAEIDYLLYFMHLCAGDEGIFRVLAGSTLDHARAVLRANGREEAARRLASPEFLMMSRSGGCVYGVAITYGSGLFHAKLEVHLDGKVEMLDDEPILADDVTARELPAAR